MPGRRHTNEEIQAILAEIESGISVSDASRSHNVSEQTIYRWKSRYRLEKPTERENDERLHSKLGSDKVSLLEEENRRLRSVLSELMSLLNLENDVRKT
ncbi:MAG: transposase [Alphaproteobacteria bacterium]